MTGKVAAYIGPNRTVIVLQPDASEGPYLPLSVISDIGYALIVAATTAVARAAIGAAARGINDDITEILGMSSVDTADVVLTPEGTANAAVLAALLAPYVPVSTVVEIDEAATADETWGVVWADSTAAAFDITVPRALGATDKSFIVLLVAGTNPVTIKDDLGAVKFTLLAAGQSLAFVSTHNNTVVAGGVT